VLIRVGRQRAFDVDFVNRQPATTNYTNGKGKGRRLSFVAFVLFVVRPDLIGASVECAQTPSLWVTLRPRYPLLFLLVGFRLICRSRGA